MYRAEGSDDNSTNTVGAKGFTATACHVGPQAYFAEDAYSAACSHRAVSSHLRSSLSSNDELSRAHEAKLAGGNDCSLHITSLDGRDHTQLASTIIGALSIFGLLPDSPFGMESIDWILIDLLDPPIVG